MTYIIVSKSKEAQKERLDKILKALFKKDVLNSPDLHILNPEDKNSIGIEEVKEFQKEMMYRPFEEEIQAGIIMEAEKLTHQAQNALLKTLEETSKFSVYFLCVNNEKNLLPTIRSRGQIVYAKRNQEEMEEELSLEELNEASILDMNLIEQFEKTEEFAKEKTSSLDLINQIEDVFRMRLELDIKNGNIDSSKKNLNCLKIIQNSREKISANCNRRLTLEAMILQLNA